MIVVLETHKLTKIPQSNILTRLAWPFESRCPDFGLTYSDTVWWQPRSVPGGFPWVCGHSVTFSRSPLSGPLAPVGDRCQEVACVKTSGEAVTETPELLLVTHPKEGPSEPRRASPWPLCMSRRAPGLFSHGSCKQFKFKHEKLSGEHGVVAFCLNKHGSFRPRMEWKPCRFYY